MKTRFLIIILVGITALLISLIVLQTFVESKELVCLRLYKDINELSRSVEMSIAESETVYKHKVLIFEYVEKACPDFQDLKLIYNNYKQTFPIMDEKYPKKSENEKETFVKISLDKFPPALKVNHSLRNFTIMLEGYYPTYNAPDIKLEDDFGNLIWTNYDHIGHVYSSRTSPIAFCKVYHFDDIGGPLIINKTGTYKMIFSFEKFSIEQNFHVLESFSTIYLDNPPEIHCP